MWQGLFFPPHHRAVCRVWVFSQFFFPRRSGVFVSGGRGVSRTRGALKDCFLQLDRRQMFLFVFHDLHLSTSPPETQPVS